MRLLAVHLTRRRGGPSVLVLKSSSSGVTGRVGPFALPAATPGPAADRAGPSTLRSNFGWTLAGNVIYAGCQWGMLVVIARLASPDAVGTFALGLAVTAPVFLFAGLHLRASLSTDTAHGFRFTEYLGVRSGGMIAGLVAIGAIVSVSGYDRPTRLVILAVGVSKAIEGMSDVYYGVMQQHERMRPIAVSLVWRGTLALVAVGTVLWAGGGLLIAVIALGASWLAVLLVHDRRAAAALLRATTHSRGWRVNWSAAGRLMATCLPLGIAMMLVSLRTNVPRYFIEGRLGTGELGVFAALASLQISGNMIVSALGQSATPRLARHCHEGNVRAFRALLARLLLIAGVVGGAGVLLSVVAGAPLLRLVFGAHYAGRAGLLVSLMGVGLVAYTTSFLGYALIAARRFTVQVPIFIATTLACAGACLWLVPAYGLDGAAWAWGASLLFEVVVIWSVLERTIRARAAEGAR